MKLEDLNDHQPIDRGKDGELLYQEDLIADIHTKLEKCRDDRRPYELQWEKNIRYYNGDQYCEVMVATDEIRELESGYEGQERRVYNKIKPIDNTRVANLKKVNSLMTAKAGSTELDDVRKADVTTKVLRAIQNRDDFKGKRNKVVVAAELTGTAFELVWWDKDAGEVCATEPQTTVLDDGTVMTEQVEYKQGDIQTNLVYCWEVFPESLLKDSVKDQRWIILEQVKKAEDIYDIYGIEAEGHNVETFQLNMTNCGGDMTHDNAIMSYGHQTVEDSCKLITYMERPSRRYPKGRLAIICDDILIHYGEFPFEEIELIKYECLQDAGHFFGRSVIEDLIPFQDAYNECYNVLGEWNKRVNVGSMIVYENSVDLDDLLMHGSEPGYVTVVNNGQPVPQYRDMPPYPAAMETQLQRLSNEMEYIAGTSQLMVSGNAPSGITSGTALQSLMEIDNTRLSMTGENIRAADKEWAKAVIRTYRKYATVNRTLSMTGVNNLGMVLYWSNKDIGDFDIVFDTDNELMINEDTQRERFIQAMQMGLFTDDHGALTAQAKAKGREIMHTGQFSEFATDDDLDRQKANNETIFFEQSGGKIIPQVNIYDNHAIHIAEHTRWVKQVNFMLMEQNSPELATLFMQHIRDHETALQGGVQ